MQYLAVDFSAGFNDAFREAILLLPKIGYFLLILVVGILLAKVISSVLTKLLQRVGFDALVERGGIKKAMAKSNYDAAGILGKIVYYFIFLLVLSAAFGVFGPTNPVSLFLAQIIAFLPNLFVAVLVLVIAAAVAAAIKDLLGNALGGLSYGSMLANVASLFVVALGVFFALAQLKIAPLIVGGIFYALLAVLIVPPIIAFGVGGIEPAREAILQIRGKAQDKAQEVRQEVQSAGDEGDEDQPDQLPTEQLAPAPPRRTRSPRTASVRARRRPTN